MHAHLGDHDHVSAIVDPKTHLARRIGKAVGTDAHADARVAFLDEAQEVDVGYRDRIDPAAVQPVEHRFHLALPDSRELGIAHCRRIEQIVELNAVLMRLLHRALKHAAIYLGQVEGGAPTTEVVGGELSVDFVHRIAGEALQECFIEIAGDGELHRVAPFVSWQKQVTVCKL